MLAAGYLLRVCMTPCRRGSLRSPSPSSGPPRSPPADPCQDPHSDPIFGQDRENGGPEAERRILGTLPRSRVRAQQAASPLPFLRASHGAIVPRELAQGVPARAQRLLVPGRLGARARAIEPHVALRAGPPTGRRWEDPRAPEQVIGLAPDETPREIELAPGLTVDDQGDGFYLVMEGNGHDVTISLDDPIALALADFVHERLRIRTGVSR